MASEAQHYKGQAGLHGACQGRVAAGAGVPRVRREDKTRGGTRVVLLFIVLESRQVSQVVVTWLLMARPAQSLSAMACWRVTERPW